jgi:hypothetical protein
MSETTTATRTITLTDRRPVRIVEEDWPVIAMSADDSWNHPDYSRYQQALNQGELDKYSIRVRQHADGRTIVYAVFVGATAWTGNGDKRDGEILKSKTGINYDDIVASIKEVGEACGLPEHVINDCIADLPPEDL